MYRLETIKRECGECQECCRLLSVEEFDSGRGDVCKHQCSTGCEIFSDKLRPDVCHDFYCSWMIEAKGFEADDMRPDICGFIAAGGPMEDGGKGLFIYQSRPGAVWKRMELIQDYNERYPLVIIEPDGVSTTVVGMGELLWDSIQ